MRLLLDISNIMAAGFAMVAMIVGIVIGILCTTHLMGLRNMTPEEYVVAEQIIMNEYANEGMKQAAMFEQLEELRGFFLDESLAYEHLSSDLQLIIQKAKSALC